MSEVVGVKIVVGRPVEANNVIEALLEVDVVLGVLEVVLDEVGAVESGTEIDRTSGASPVEDFVSVSE